MSMKKVVFWLTWSIAIGGCVLVNLALNVWPGTDAAGCWVLGAQVVCFFVSLLVMMRNGFPPS
jgi:hypothetical protein